MATTAIVFLFGLCIGSFLNVCIHRLPLGQSVVRPRSRCPKCSNPIAAYDNIPVLSYVLLGGRCRHCRTRISPQYPLVELLTGLVWALAYVSFDLTLAGLKAALLASAMIVLVFTDLHHRTLPDTVTLPGIGVGLLFAIGLPIEDNTATLLWRWVTGGFPPTVAASVVNALLGAAIGAGILYGLGELWFRLRKVEAMGLGDVKMMAMVGMFLGPKLATLTLLLGSLAGSLLGSLFILLARKDAKYELPFGSFLGAAAIAALFWGEPLIDLYTSLFP
ncbi:MAG TPA: prepilin peptidase [Candidatus Xenobia bacterium]|nr:prepilin peptidase [Candidatus Xenobia bacterium]